MGCPSCGKANRTGAKFCDECGTPLQVVGEPTPGDTGSDAGRRPMTVLFCDLVDSTTLASRLDPEDYSGVVRLYQEYAIAGVERYEGHIAQYLGDGVLAYFGWPLAHEDDAERAVRAALVLVDSLGELNARLERELGVSVSLRTGIHTGPVVIREMGKAKHKEMLAVGDTINVAARLQSVASPDTVVISALTRRLVRGRFVTEDLGPQRLKGIAHEVPVWRVLRPSDDRDASGSHPDWLAPFVGRERERALLLERWERALRGNGQAFLVRSEAGLGKSRLAQAIRREIAAHTWIECRCSPYHRSSAFYPVIEFLEHALELDRSQPAEAQIEQIEAALPGAGPQREEVVPLLAALLSIPLPGRYTRPALSPDAQRARTLEALTTLVLALAEDAPVSMLIEDLHWVDPSTLEFIGMLIERLPGTRLLLLLTFRPTFESPWESPQLTAVTLHPLEHDQIAEMVAAISADAAIPAEVQEQVAARADGVPLFAEELTRAVLEVDLEEAGGNEASRSQALGIPSTLAASLMARLDRLGPAKGVAQMASVLGRAFSEDLMASVCIADASEVEQGLASLASAGILLEGGPAGRPGYHFRHALIQDAAYQSLLRSQRRELHGRVAAALEEQFPDRVDDLPQELGRHQEGAALWSQAAASYQRAGERATARSANEEAMEHLRHGLELLAREPHSRERDRQELGLQVALGVPAIAARGQGSAEVETTYTRAWELCETLDDSPQHFQALCGLAAFHRVRGVLPTATVLGERLLAVAGEDGDRTHRLLAHHGLGCALYYAGEWRRALEHLEEGARLYDPERHGLLGFAYGTDPGVQCLTFSAWTLWVLGRPDAALERVRRAAGAGRSGSHPLSLCLAVTWSALVHQLRQEPKEALARADETIAICGERGFPLFMGLGMVVRGWARAVSAGGDEALADIQQGMAQIAGTGVGSGASYPLALLAEAQLRAGRADDTVGAVGFALGQAEERGHHFWDPELYRLKGDGLQALGKAGDAEAAYRRAIEVARRQEAASLELRAGVALARLLHERGRADEARALLAPIHARFHEGLGTPDVARAAAFVGGSGA